MNNLTLGQCFSTLSNLQTGKMTVDFLKISILSVAHCVGHVTTYKPNYFISSKTERVYLVVSSLFNNDLSVIWDYIVSNEGVRSKLWVGKVLEGSSHGPILRYYPGICLEELKKTMKKPQYSQSLGLDLNPGPPEYEAGVLMAWLGCLVCLFTKIKINAICSIKKSHIFPYWMFTIKNYA
jgi:hypothetical protein